MKIGLLDADLMDHGTRHPNLALMKIAGFYKGLGKDVKLIYKNYEEVYEYDKVFISKVFTFSKIPDWVISLENVTIGGTGFFEDGGENLPDEIEHHMPYYDLYKDYVTRQLELGCSRSRYIDYLDYSIGFTTRGCFRKCEFCVNKKYSRTFLHSPVAEFFDESRPYIYLWDDNFLASPEWEAVLDDIEAAGRPFQFRQGLDLRLMTDEKAKRFAKSRHQGDFIFAFDHIEDKELIVEKVQLWKRYSSKVCKMYILCAYKSQDESDIADVFKRVHTLMRYGSLPYIMRYESYKISPYKNLYIELARWCNQPNFFKKMSFREFCIANQNYKKDQSTICSAYQAMLNFESKFPKIAKDYFDLRFDKESVYITQYGYGRKYANKPPCRDCKKYGIYWDAFMNSDISKDALLQAYFTKEIDLECLRYATTECKCSPADVSNALISAILSISVNELVELIGDSPQREPVTKDNIPQISNLDCALYDVASILLRSGEVLSFERMGYYLTRDDPTFKQNEIANKKYGENHAKIAALLDIVLIDKSGSRAHISLSQFGRSYCVLPKEEQTKLAKRLCLRIPIIQNYLIEGCSDEQIDSDLNILSKATKKRRGSKLKDMIQLVEG